MIIIILLTIFAGMLTGYFVRRKTKVEPPKHHKHYTLLCDLCNTVIEIETPAELTDEDYICPMCESYMEVTNVEEYNEVQTYTYNYPMPSVTADAVIFSDDKVLLIKRLSDPFAGAWALPGGYVEYNENITNGLTREVKEEAGIDVTYQCTCLKEHAKIYDEPSRDPRGRVITVVNYYEIDPSYLKNIQSGDDAADIAWFPINDLPELAFDHGKIIKDAIDFRTPPVQMLNESLN